MGYRLCPKLINFSLVTCKAPHILPMEGLKGQKNFNLILFYILLENALKVLPSHFQFEQMFAFWLFTFLGVPKQATKAS